MAITCQQAEEWFDRQLDGETLSPRQERDLRRHRDECPRCRRRLIREEHSVAALNALPPVEPPAGMAGRVLDALPTVSPRLLGRVSDVLRQAATDASLRSKLRADPAGTLRGLGLDLPANLRVEIVTDLPAPLPRPDLLPLPLPEAPLQVQELEERLAALGLGPLFGFWW